MTSAGGERLVVVGPSPPPTYGVSVLTDRVVKSLRSAGLLAAYLNTADARTLENLGRFDLTNLRLGIWHAVKLGRLLASNPGTAVYLPLAPSRWGFLRDALFIALARLWRRRVYVHLHGGTGLRDLDASAGLILRTVLRVTTRAVHQAWALTPTLAHDSEGLFPNRVRVLENVVEDLGRIRRIVRGPEPPDGMVGSPNILYLSSLIPEKGCFDLLEAVDLLGKRALGWHLRVIGDAPTPLVRGAMLRRARELRGVRIELPGAVTGDAKRDEYRWADIFVLPSRYPFEAQPLAILEALAAGLPVVATLHAGIPDTVRDHEEGLLVPPGDTRALGAALARLAADPKLRADLGRRARQRYESSYHPARLDRDLVTLLREGAPR